MAQFTPPPPIPDEEDEKGSVSKFTPPPPTPDIEVGATAAKFTPPPPIEDQTNPIDDYDASVNAAEKLVKTRDENYSLYGQLFQKPDRTPDEDKIMQDAWQKGHDAEISFYKEQDVINSLQPTVDQITADQKQARTNYIEDKRNSAIFGDEVANKLYDLDAQAQKEYDTARTIEDRDKRKKTFTDIQSKYQTQEKDLMSGYLDKFSQKESKLKGAANVLNDAAINGLDVGSFLTEKAGTAPEYDELRKSFDAYQAWKNPIEGTAPLTPEQEKSAKETGRLYEDAQTMYDLAGGRKNTGIVNGEIRVSPMAVWNTDAIKQEVAGLDAPEAQKQKTIASLPALQEEAANLEYPFLQQVSEFNNFVKANDLQDAAPKDQIAAWKSRNENWADYLLKIPTQAKLGLASGSIDLVSSSIGFAGGTAQLFGFNDVADPLINTAVKIGNKSQEFNNISREIGGPTLVAEFAAVVPQLALQMAIGKGAGLGAKGLGFGPKAISNIGFGTSIGTVMAQSYGGTYIDAIQKIEQDKIDKGTDPIKARAEAIKEAQLPAALNGVIEAATTLIGGKKGAEGIFREGVDSIKAKLNSSAFRAELPRLFPDIVGGITNEGMEELTAQLAQGFVEQATFNPQLTTTDVINNAVKAFIIGGASGGAVEGLKYGFDYMKAPKEMTRRTKEMAGIRDSISQIEKEISEYSAGSPVGVGRKRAYDAMLPSDEAAALGGKAVDKTAKDRIQAEREGIAKLLEDQTISRVARNDLEEKLANLDIEYYSKILVPARINVATEQIADQLGAMKTTAGKDAITALTKIANGGTLDILTGRERVAIGVTRTGANKFAISKQNPMVQLGKNGSVLISETGRRVAETLGVAPLVKMIGISNSLKSKIDAINDAVATAEKERAAKEAKDAAESTDAQKYGPESAKALKTAADAAAAAAGGGETAAQKMARILKEAEAARARAAKAITATPEQRITEREGKPAEVVETPTGTRIEAAAYMAPDGTVYYGASHLDAMAKARDAGKIDQATIDAKQEPTSRETPEFGYSTDQEGFISRDQAEAIARKSNQMLVEKTATGQLHSNEVELDAFPKVAAPQSAAVTMLQPDLVSPEGKTGDDYSTTVANNRRAVVDFINGLDDGRYQLFDYNGDKNGTVVIRTTKSGKKSIQYYGEDGSVIGFIESVIPELNILRYTKSDGSESYGRGSIQKIEEKPKAATEATPKTKPTEAATKPAPQPETTQPTGVTIFNYDEKIKPIEDSIDAEVDRLMKMGSSFEDAMNTPSVKALLDQKYKIDREAIKNYRSFIIKAFTDHGIIDDSLTYTPAFSIMEKIYGSPRYENEGFIVNVYEYGSKALSNDRETIRKLSESIFKYRAEAEGLDPAGLLGPSSGLTDAGKKARVDEARLTAEAIHKQIKDSLIGETKAAPEVRPIIAVETLNPRGKQAVKILTSVGVDPETAAYVASVYQDEAGDMGAEEWRDFIRSKFEQNGGVIPAQMRYSEDPEYYQMAFNVGPEEATTMAENGRYQNQQMAQNELEQNKQWRRKDEQITEAKRGVAPVAPEAKGAVVPEGKAAPRPAIEGGRVPIAPTKTKAVTKTAETKKPLFPKLERFDEKYINAIRPSISQRLDYSPYFSELITKAAGRKLSKEQEVEVIIEWLQYQRDIGQDLVLWSDFGGMSLDQAYMIEPALVNLGLLKPDETSFAKIQKSRQQTIIDKAKEERGKKPEANVTIERKNGRVKALSLRPSDTIGKSVRDVLRFASRINLSSIEGSLPNEILMQDVAAILAEMDLPALDLEKIVTLASHGKTGTRATRFWDGDIGFPSKKKVSIQTLVHEVGHSITADQIKRYAPRKKINSGKEYIDELRRISADKTTPEPISRLFSLYVSTLEQLGIMGQYGAVDGMAGARTADTSVRNAQAAQRAGRLRKDLNFSQLYGLANVEEFVSQTFSSPDFRDLLKGLKAPDGKRSAWSVFVDAIKAILNLPNNSMAAAVIEASVDVGMEVPATRTKGAGLPEEGLPPVDSVFEDAAFSGKEGFKSRSKIINISIDDFLKLVTTLPSEQSQEAQKSFDAGIKWESIPYLGIKTDENGIAKITGHEGRHRALVLKRAGYTEMPVEIRDRSIRWSSQNNPNDFDYVENFPTELEAETGRERIPFPFTREQSAALYEPDEEIAAGSPEGKTISSMVNEFNIADQASAQIKTDKPTMAMKDIVADWIGIEGATAQDLKDSILEFTNLSENQASNFAEAVSDQLRIQKALDEVQKEIDAQKAQDLKAPEEAEPEFRKYRFYEITKGDLDRRMKRMVDKTYQVLTNDVSIAEANEALKGLSIEAAIAAIKDMNNGIKPAVRSMMADITYQKIMDFRRKSKKDGRNREYREITDLHVDFYNWISEYRKDLGQGVQAFARFADLGPDGMLRHYTKYVDAAISKYTKKNRKKLKDLSDEMNSATEDEFNKAVAAANKLAKEKIASAAKKEAKIGVISEETLKVMQGIIRSEKPTLWENYQQLISNRLLKALMADPNKTPPPSLVLFTNRLVQNMLGFVPEAQRRTPPASVQSYIEDALNNKEKYQEAFDKTLRDISKKIETLAAKEGDKATAELMRAIAAKEFLDKLAPQIKDFPVSTKMVDRFIVQKTKQLGISLIRSFNTWYKSSLTERAALEQELAQALVDDVNIPEADAKRLADGIVADFRVRAEARRKKILERFKEPKKEGEVEKPSKLDKFFEFVNMGFINDRGAYEILTERYKLPVFDEKFSKYIYDMAQKIQDMDNGLMKRLYTQKLMAEIAKQKGFAASELGSGFVYANMLSSLDTHMVNIIDTLLNNFANATADAIATGDMSRFIGLMKGLRGGWSEAINVLKTGLRISAPGFEEYAPSTLELNQFGQKGGVKLTEKTAAHSVLKALLESKPAKLLNISKYIGRLLEAQDAINFTMSVQGQRYADAAAIAKEEGVKGRKAVRQRINELLNAGDEAYQAALLQAEKEGYSGYLKTHRAIEITEEKIPEAIKQRSFERGLRDVYRNKPTGVAGGLADMFVELVDRKIENPLARTLTKLTVSPFVVTPVNVFNKWLDWSPWGYKRLFFGSGNIMGDKYRVEPFERGTPEWRAQLLKASSSVFALALVKGLIQAGVMAIEGSGPSDEEERKDWLGQGNKPYTVGFKGGPMFSFAYLPWAVNLAWLANMENYEKYNKGKDDGMMERALVSMMYVAKITMELPFMSGVADLVDLANPRSTVSASKRFEKFAEGKIGMVFPNGLRYLDRLFDPKVYNTQGLRGIFMDQTPFVRTRGGKVLNLFGEQIGEGKSLVERLASRFVALPKPSVASELLAKFDVYPYIEKAGKAYTVINGERAVMDQDEYEKYATSVGKEFKQYLLENYDLKTEYSEEEKIQIAKDIRTKMEDLRREKRIELGSEE